jgi:hypothetical protein
MQQKLFFKCKVFVKVWPADRRKERCKKGFIVKRKQCNVLIDRTFVNLLRSDSHMNNRAANSNFTNAMEISRSVRVKKMEREIGFFIVYFYHFLRFENWNMFFRSSRLFMGED